MKSGPNFPPQMPQPPHGAQTSPLSMIQNELSFKKDAGAIFGIVFKGLMAAMAQITFMFTMLMIGWLIHGSVFGQVIFPSIFKACVGVFQNLVPTVVGAYAMPIALVVLGGAFIYPMALSGFKMIFPDRDNKKIRNKAQGQSPTDLAYYIGACFVPIALFCYQYSSGTLIWSHLTWPLTIAGVVAAGATMVEKGQEYLQTVMMRAANRQAQQQRASQQISSNPAPSPQPKPESKEAPAPAAVTPSSGVKPASHQISVSAPRESTKPRTAKPATSQPQILPQFAESKRRSKGASSAKEGTADKRKARKSSAPKKSEEKQTKDKQPPKRRSTRLNKR